MKLTSLSVLTNNEFIGYLFLKQNKTEAEIEAEQRLTVAIDRIRELEDPYGNYPRGESKSCMQANT